MKLILKNGAEYDVGDMSSINVIFLDADSFAAAGICDALTKENLSHVKLGDLEYSNMVFSRVEATRGSDGKANIHITLRERTEREILLDRIEALEKSQALQDGAIDDLGNAVSDLEGK